MLLQFSCDVFDISPDKQDKIDNLYIPDLLMLLFTQKVTQNKKYSYHVTYHATPKSLKQFLQCLRKLEADIAILNVISELFQNLSQLQHVFGYRVEILHGTADVRGSFFHIQSIAQDDLVTRKIS